MSNIDFSPLSNFMIAESSQGQLYVFMEAKGKNVDSPHIVYDGKEHAILFMNDDNGVILDYINPEVRKKLANSREVVVVETILEDVRNTYCASMRFVKEMDFDFSGALQ